MGNYSDSDDDSDISFRQTEQSFTILKESDIPQINSMGSYVSSDKQSFTILKESDIRQRQNNDISTLAAVLSIPHVAATILLVHYKWNNHRLHDAWFSDEGEVRRKVGLLEKPVYENPLDAVEELTCGICFEAYPISKIETPSCGHPFCLSCWEGYIETSIKDDGPGCLMLRCPHPACAAAVDQDMINLLASDEDKKKYDSYLLRYYIECNKKIKWCPAPGCEYAVYFDAVGTGDYDVSCLCSYKFCWNCTQEAHRPVDCDTVLKWNLKNIGESESETTNWLLAYSKPCPKCKRPIEKSSGCSHMTCATPCKFEFCWQCLGAWKEHMGSCNRYETDETQKRIEIAKNSIERYTHYYERWASKESARQKAVANLQKMQTVGMIKQFKPKSQRKFIIDAWLQIVECRRILKWTCVYGYYLPDNVAKKQFFEYLQGEAESSLERLHQCAEKELHVLLSDDVPLLSKEFKDFRIKLIGLTYVARNYFENLVRALENGLCDVDSVITDDHWFCEQCTFANLRFVNACQMCNQKRPWKSI